MKKSVQFVQNENTEVYVLQFKKRNYWWLLLFLLLLLPLLLLIRFEKTVIFKTVNAYDGKVLSGTEIKFEFLDRNFFSFKTHSFFTKDTVFRQDTANAEGKAIFAHVSYSLYTRLFHSSDLAEVQAINRCFMGDSLQPRFFDLKNEKETLLKLPERTYNLDFKVIDADDNQVIPDGLLKYICFFAKNHVKKWILICCIFKFLHSQSDFMKRP